MFDWLRNLAIRLKNLFLLFSHSICRVMQITSLMGVSVEKAAVKVMGTKLTEEGPLLITHWGMSGPAILRLSAWGARQLAE
jgi:predicted flavoprotein YhiN